MTDLPNTTIAELLNQIENGDDKAVIRLYQHYHGFLYAFVRHRISCDADAEEVAHDVLLAICKKPQAFGGQSKFSTWLCSIAKFKIIDFLRKQGTSLQVDGIDDELIQNHPDPNWDFVARLEAKEDEEAFRRCIDALPVGQRDAIFWIYYQDEGLEVVATRQECPVGTVKSRLFNARKRLRECMHRWLEGGRYV